MEEKSFWFQDFVTQKVEAIRPKLYQHLPPELQKQVDNDSLDHDQVLQLIQLIFEHDLQWSEHQVKNAWPRTRHVKNETASIKAREQGNAHMKTGSWTKALTMYNEAVILAPDQSQALSLGLANRAFVWMKLDQSDKAEPDLLWIIQLNNYPTESLYKIYQRLGLVKHKLRKINEAKEAFQQAIQLMKHSNCTADQKRNLIEELKINIKNADKIKITFEPEEAKLPELTILEEHLDLKDFSNKLSVVFSEDKGRYSVANAVIEPGEVICKTTPVTSIIFFNNVLEFCYNCLSHVISAVPCTYCSAVVFCSQSCLEMSKKRHVYDCQLSMLDIYLANGSWGIGATCTTFLALKAMTVKQAQFFIDHCADFHQVQIKELPQFKQGFDDLDVLFNSVTHLATSKDKLVKIYMSVFIYQLLKSTGYFEALENLSTLDQHFQQDLRSDSRVFFVNLMLHFMLASYSNNHCLTASNPGQFNRHKYGLAIFSRVVSLLNHSCNPNTGIVVSKDTQITVATKKIYPGEEICQVYQGHFADTPIEKRRQLMNDFYHFTCTCIACTDKYPLYQDLEAEFQHEDYQALTTKVQNAFDCKDYYQGSQLMIQRLKLVSEHLKEPHQLYIKDRAAYLECLWQCYANKTFVVNSKIQ